MSAVIIDSGVVHYEAFGRGRPVLFLHGWLGSWRYWMSTMAALAGTYRTYALDLWGFGDSDKSKARYSVSDYVTMVENFVQTMGIRNATFIGHSLGAAVMLAYMAQYPERVNKMVAISLPLHSEGINRKLLGAGNKSVLDRLIWWRQRFFDKDIEAEAEKATAGAIRDSLQSVTRMDIPAYIQSIGQSQNKLLLIVYGEKDPVIDPGPARSLNGRWSNIRPIGLAESRYFPMLDEANKFQRLLKDFLETEGDLSVLELKEEWRRRAR